MQLPVRQCSDHLLRSMRWKEGPHEGCTLSATGVCAAGEASSNTHSAVLITSTSTLVAERSELAVRSSSVL
eukprot:19779-Heterococcus_DN1.PRE.1